MSKYQKALNKDKNAIYEWEIKEITKSNKVGKSLDGPAVMRSRLFWLKLPDGKELVFFYKF